MIQLHARLTEVSLQRKLQRLVYRIGEDVNNMGCFELTSLDSTQPKMVLIHDAGRPISDLECDYVVVPTAMNYLKPGDIVSLSADGKTLNTLWRGNGTTNTLLLTERCDNYCLMCSQPPREREDGYLLEQAFDVISLMPKDAHEIGFSGGEPTLYGDSFVDLVRHVRDELPETSLHILSNGRRFADPIFAAKYAHATSAGTMVGIPIYGAESSLHDHVVQANGAFEETIKGILNLGELGQAIEIRVVLHAQTAPHIVEIADYIARNLPFVDQVALMGMEMMGLARRNIGQLWIEPYMYAEDLAEATELLHAHRIHTMIYNHQLCVLHRDIWDFAVKSISDWKNEYDPICADCDVLERCGGFFHSAKYGSSDQVTPLNSDGSPKNKHISQVGARKPASAWSRRRIPITPISD
jgi:His-Xaa-Ser system radical SAM maturase HxsC